jgi:hypothetical protein
VLVLTFVLVRVDIVDTVLLGRKYSGEQIGSGSLAERRVFRSLWSSSWS